ncbi:MAG: ankyrin repeat domain-containing protein [Vicinamibacterales bacterium]
MLPRALPRLLAAAAIGAVCLSSLVRATSTSPIADAAMQRDTAAIKALLKQAGDVNAAQADGMTALHWAAMNGDAELAQLLLYAGANLKAATRLGSYTPLFLASQQGHAPVIETLIKGGGDANAATPSGTTPLMVAAASGRTDAVKVLLDHGANVNARESNRQYTPLMFAASADRPKVIEQLIAAGADVKATSKVVDLSALTRADGSIAGLQLGNPAPPPGNAGAGEPADSGRRGFGVTRPAPSSEPPAPEPTAKSPEPVARTASAAGNTAAPASGTRPARKPMVAGADRQYMLNELVAYQGGMTPLLFAARQGYAESVRTLLHAGADVNQVSAGDRTSPLLIATINGHLDLAQMLLEQGADPNLASENGAAPLYAALNVQWAPKALYPQPRAYQQQKTTYLDLMKTLLAKGADPNARLVKKVWYSGYSFDLSGVDEIGATPFWRAAYASDVEAMKLLVANGADPAIPTIKPAGRPRTGDGGREKVEDVSGVPPVPVGGPGVTPLQAAAGVGYGEGFAANAHRFAPTGMLAAVKYLVEDLGADVNAVDHEGNTALHHAAARGDVEMITYLASKGANVKAVNREGQTTADMANGPVQRIQPFPEAIAVLEKLGAKNNHKCVSC